MNTSFAFDESIFNSTSSIKDEDIDSIFEAFRSGDKIATARSLLGLIRNQRVDCLPKTVVDHIIKSALNEKLRPRFREICFILLQHMVTDDSKLIQNNTYHPSLPDLSGYFLTIDPKNGSVEDVISAFQTAVENPRVNIGAKAKILSFFSHLSNENPNCIDAGTVQSISLFMLQWLHGTSSIEFFSKSPYTELDGTPTRDLFTVLNQPQTVTVEHMLHSQIFSMLQLWLHNCHKLNKCMDSSNNKQQFVPLPVSAVSKIIEYSCRLIEQTNLIPSKTQDVALQLDCLFEAVSLLNMMCIFDKCHVSASHQVLRTTFNKHCHRDKSAIHLSSVPVILQCLHFFLNHGAAVDYDTHASLELFFKSLNHSIIMDSVASSNIMSFLIDNLEKICYDTCILDKYFPDLIKIVAWQPQLFCQEFSTILPAIMTTTTALEVINSVIDLPCITGALIVEDYKNNKCAIDLPPDLGELLEQSQSAIYKPMFNFMLRTHSGIGDTFTKIGNFHSLLKPVWTNGVVVSSSIAACHLLQIYLETITSVMDEDLCSRLIATILERSVLLMTVPTFVDKMQDLMCSMLRNIIKVYPHFIVLHHADFLEYIAIVRHFYMAQTVYTQIVWMIGEMISTEYVSNCTSELITSSYETLECCLYEITSSGRDQVGSYKVICMLAMAMTKLASRCQDRVPRVLLCLTKVLKEVGCNDDEYDEFNTILCNRLNELVAILKMPNITSAILSPPQEIEKGLWHRDNCSTTALVKTANTVLCRK